MSTLASTTGVDAYDRAFQLSMGLYQVDLEQAALNAKLAIAPFFNDKPLELFGDPNMTSGQALINHLRRVYAAGMSYGVNVDNLVNQLRQLGAL